MEEINYENEVSEDFVDTPIDDILFEQIQICPIDDHSTMGLTSDDLITIQN